MLAWPKNHSLDKTEAALDIKSWERTARFIIEAASIGDKAAINVIKPWRLVLDLLMQLRAKRNVRMAVGMPQVLCTKTCRKDRTLGTWEERRGKAATLDCAATVPNCCATPNHCPLPDHTAMSGKHSAAAPDCVAMPGESSAAVPDHTMSFATTDALQPPPPNAWLRDHACSPASAWHAHLLLRLVGGHWRCISMDVCKSNHPNTFKCQWDTGSRSHGAACAATATAGAWTDTGTYIGKTLKRHLWREPEPPPFH